MASDAGPARKMRRIIDDDDDDEDLPDFATAFASAASKAVTPEAADNDDVITDDEGLFSGEDEDQDEDETKAERSSALKKR